MPWFKVDDNLAFHQKTLRAGNAAMGLWVRAGSWSAQQLSDGFVPTAIARSLGTPAEAGRLVAARLWLERDEGYEFWQWSEEGRQPSRVEVEEKRKDARERQRRAREAAKSRRDSERDTPRDGDVTHAPVTAGVTVPPTRPDPTRPEVPNGTPTSGPRKRGERIDPDWRPAQTDVEWQRAAGISDPLARRELPKFIDYWTAKSGKDAAKLDWSATWRNWLRTAIEREPTQTRSPRDPLASARPR